MSSVPHRVALAAFALLAGSLAVAGCKPDPAPSAKQTPAVPPPPPIKRQVDHTPLPPLSADRGGATGNPVWGIGFGGLGIDAPRAIAVAPGGDSFIVGYFDGEIDLGAAGKRTPAIGKAKPADGKPADGKPADGKPAAKPGSDVFVVQLTVDGKLGWVQTFGAGRDDVANGVAVSGERVVVAGQFLDELKLGELVNPAAGSDDIFVAAFDRAGEPQWLFTAGGIDSDGANAVAAAPDGGWVVGGSFSRTAEFQHAKLTSRGGTDAMLIKLSAKGELEWIKQFGGLHNDTISHIAIDARGNIYVQGVFREAAEWGGAPLSPHGGSDNDIVLAKYDLNGDHLWSQNFGNAFNDVAGGLTVDPAGNLTMVGSFDRSVSFGDSDDHRSAGESDAFIARFTTLGKLTWARTFGADREDIAFGVAADAAGNTVAIGWFQNKIDFGTGAIAAKGNKDAFAVKLDPAGKVVWAKTWGDRDHDQARGVAIDDQGAAIVVGIYRFTLDLVSPALESVRADGDRVPKPDVFAIKLAR